jgi:ZIP family zinc transporter
MNGLLIVFVYAMLPVGAGILGGIIAVVRPPGPYLRNCIQHFAAGVVFAVAAVELLPDIMKRHLAWEVGFGFAAGVGVMLGLKFIGQRIEERAQRREGKGVTTVLAAVGIDIFIDGLLLGIGFAAGAKEGRLLTFALTTELLSLGLATAVALRAADFSRRRSVLNIVGVSCLLLLGAGVGATVSRTFSPELMELVLAFALAALLYLVTEELLVEAHEEKETPAITAVFFGGFLLFLLIGMQS